MGLIQPKSDTGSMGSKAYQAISTVLRACPFASSLLQRQILHDEQEDCQKVSAASLQELPARVHVFKMLVGQTMMMAREHAEKVFDLVVEDLFRLVGEWFSMSPVQVR